MTLHVGDCFELLPTMDEQGVDAVICDPPYHMTSIVRRFGPDGSAPPRGGVYRRSAGGFMGQRWDGGDLAFRPETWAAVLRVLRPGGYLAAMGATRGWHRTACAIEDAGFEIRDSLCWLYGSGFPKSKNGVWGGSALKPAWEPVVLARRPMDGGHRENFTLHGTGGLNVAAARVPLTGDTVPEFENEGEFDPKPGRSYKMTTRRTGRIRAEEDPGRWPANVVHDGSEAVVGAMGNSPGAFYPKTITNHPRADTGGMFDALKGTGETANHDFGPGPVARFFYTAKPSRAEKEAGLDGFARDLKPAIKRKVEADLTLTDATCGYTCGGTTPRANTHPTVKPVELMRWLVRLLTRPGQTVLDPFAGSGTTAIACALEGRLCVAVERDPAYAAIAEARIAWWTREARRKPGRSVAEILGEGPRGNAPPRGAQGASQGVLL